MAIATSTTREVPTTTYVTEDAIELLLSPVEAATLVRVLRNVGGSPVDSARKHTDAIARALLGEGSAPTPDDPRFPSRGSFYFDDAAV